jgi:hypothetical protein
LAAFSEALRNELAGKAVEIRKALVRRRPRLIYASFYALTSWVGWLAR